VSLWFGRWKNEWKDISKGNVLRQNTVGVVTADVSLSLLQLGSMMSKM